MTKQIGDQVSLNGKTYTISGFHKRSYLLKDASGREYKCGPDKLDRIEAGIPRQKRSVSADMSYFTSHIQYNRIFKINVQMPTAQNANYWIGVIESELSSENLHCDGEASRSVVIAKTRKLQAALSYVESLR